MERSNRYTYTAMVLHWMVALLIVGNVALVWVIDWLPDGAVRPAIDVHKSTGLTVLGLVLLRVLWRLGHRPPPLPASYPVLERRGAHAAHLVLYGLMLGLPLSGWLHDSAFKDAAAHPLTIFGLPWFRIGALASLDPVAKEQAHALWYSVHSWLGWGLYALLALHILGALKHQFVDKHGEFGRMLPWGRAEGG